MEKTNIIQIQGIAIDLSAVASTIAFEQEDIIFAGGSVIEGCGNEYSDIDYFLVLDKPENYEAYDHVYHSSVHKVVASRHEHICVNYEVWRRDILETFISQINTIDFSDIHSKLYKQVDVAPRQDLKFITSFFHRMFTGKCIHNEDGIQKLTDKLNKNQFFRFIIRSNMKQINNMYDDVLGNLSTGRIEVSAYVAREMLIIALGMYLNSLHITVDRNKWILDKLIVHAQESVGSEEILKSVRQLLFFDDSQDLEQLEKNIKRIIVFVNDLIGIITNQQGGL